MSSQKQRRPAVPKNTCPKTGIAQTRKMKPWGQRPRLSAERSSASENRVSENRVSENRVSENRVSENRGAERTLPSTLLTQALSAALDFDVPVAAPRRTHPTPAAERRQNAAPDVRPGEVFVTGLPAPRVPVLSGSLRKGGNPGRLHSQ